MRVLQIGLSKNPGGIEVVVMRFFRRLIHDNIVFDFIDIYGDGLAFDKEIVKLGGRIYTLDNYKKNLIKAKKKIREIIANGNYKCVHINMLSAANIIPVLAACEAHVVPIIHAHNNKTEGIIRKIAHTLNVRKLRCIPSTKLACSASAGKWMFDDKEFYVMPNALDLTEFAFNNELRLQIRTKYNIMQNDIVLGYIGRLTPQKNPLFLLDVLEETRKKLSINVKLMIVGDGELRIKMEKIIQQKSLSDFVIFAGRLSSTSMMYSAMDCFLLPSNYEGLGVVAIEAQANGLPCCVSDAIPHEAIVTNRIVALSIDDAKKWGSQIKELISCGFNRSDVTFENSMYDITNVAEIMKKVYDSAETNL